MKITQFIQGALLTAWLGLALTACGGGDPVPDSAPQMPLTLQVSGGTEDSQVSLAQALPAPAPAVAPVLRDVPPAPTDGLPPRAPMSASAKLAPAGRTDLVAPSILRQTVMTGLIAPTDMAFASDGILFYTERQRGLFVQRPGQAAASLFSPRGLAATESLGMLSVAVDPEFARNRFVYVLTRALASGIETSRVVRLTLDEALVKVAYRRDILVVEGDASASAGTYGMPLAGGALRFGPDGFLYIGLGDGRAALPQAPQGLAGKVLRVDREGKAAPANRAVAGHDARVFAYGMRDPVALAFHPGTETLLVAQRHGDRPDDLTWLRPGTNGGWDPRCVASVFGACEPGSGSDASQAVRGWRAGKPGEGLTALERLGNPMWREWRNAFVVAFDKAQRLDLVKFDGQGRVTHTAPVVQKLGVGFKAAAQGPDGLYVMTSGKRGGDEIWRLLAQ